MFSDEIKPEDITLENEEPVEANTEYSEIEEAGDDAGEADEKNQPEEVNS